MTTLYLVGAVVAVAGLAIWLAIRNARSRGRAEAIGEQAEKQGETAQDARRIDDEVKGMTDDELNESLRSDRDGG